MAKSGFPQFPDVGKDFAVVQKWFTPAVSETIAKLAPYWNKFQGVEHGS